MYFSHLECSVPCGAGPFKLPAEGWQRGHTLTVVRHDGYFRSGDVAFTGGKGTLTLANGALTASRLSIAGKGMTGDLRLVGHEDGRLPPPVQFR